MELTRVEEYLCQCYFPLNLRSEFGFS